MNNKNSYFNKLSKLDFRLKQVKLHKMNIAGWVFPAGDTRPLKVKFCSEFLVEWLKIQIKAFSALEAEAKRIKAEKNRLIAMMYLCQ
ncbi:hypothetical protein [Yersinia intermedia]|uniref:hypothetical protein n=1 Tax=Yersinia intermedia TaxID=631 RepID=UPI00065D8F2C|nr:hypothetical protein [Yersinia intermedia]CRY84159.1 Uncharacterised protein [Yersinia intermedia]